MATTIPGPAQNAHALICPICGRPILKLSKAKPLLNMKVCKKCRNQFASWRQVAYILDVVLLNAVPTVVIMMLAFILFDYNPPNSGPVISFLGLSDPFEAVVHWGLWLLFLCKDGFNGMSLGKLITGVQVVDVRTRQPISFGQSFKRNLVLLVPFAPLVIIVSMMKGRRWGDSWAGTVVIWRPHAHKPPFDPHGFVCASCGYDLRGNVSGRCPECFTPVPERKRSCPNCLSPIADLEAVFCTQCGQGLPRAAST